MRDVGIQDDRDGGGSGVSRTMCAAPFTDDCVFFTNFRVDPLLSTHLTFRLDLRILDTIRD
eukprot:1434245-Pyramimonas_sp.AAC.1